MIEIFIPKMGANIETVDIGKIYKNKGDTVKKGEILFDIITDKATFSIEADAAGTILSLDCKEGQTITVLEIVGYIGNPGEQPLLKIERPEEARSSLPQGPEPGNQKNSRFSPGFPCSPSTTIPSQSTSSAVISTIKATPAARKLAKDNNIDITTAFATFQRVIKEQDILGYIEKNKADKAQAISLSATSSLPLTPKKKIEIKHLSKSKEYIISAVTITIATTKIKQKIQALAQRYNIRLTMQELIAHTAAQSIQKYPKVNAYYSQDTILQYNEVNIGIAMNPGDELIVPIIHRVNTLDIAQFSTKMKEMIMKVIKNQLELKDLENGTFTITDLSSYSVIEFMPVINSNQSAILGICAEYDSWKNENNKPVYDPKMNLILAFDHRVIDGKYAAEFLQFVKKKLLE